MFAASDGLSGRGPIARMAWSAFAAATLTTTVALGTAYARPPLDNLDQVSIDDLKQSYLACHRASMRHALDSGEAMHCSVIYEALKHRAFGGDFERVLAWTRAQPSPEAGATRADAPGASSCLAEDL